MFEEVYIEFIGIIWAEYQLIGNWTDIVGTTVGENKYSICRWYLALEVEFLSCVISSLTEEPLIINSVNGSYTVFFNAGVCGW